MPNTCTRAQKASRERANERTNERTGFALFVIVVVVYLWWGRLHNSPGRRARKQTAPGKARRAERQHPAILLVLLRLLSQPTATVPSDSYKVRSSAAALFAHTLTHFTGGRLARNARTLDHGYYATVGIYGTHHGAREEGGQHEAKGDLREREQEEVPGLGLIDWPCGHHGRTAVAAAAAAVAAAAAAATATSSRGMNEATTG